MTKPTALHAEVNFYPDAGRAEHVRVGSFLFVIDEGTAYVGFYPARDGGVGRAQTMSGTSPGMRGLLGTFDSFIAELSRRLVSDRSDSLTSLAAKFIAMLPYNFRVTDLQDWPPTKILADSAGAAVIVHSAGELVTA